MRAFSFVASGSRGQSAQDHPAIHNANVGVLADAAQILLVDDDHATIIHPHLDVIGVAGDILLDLVAGHGAGSGTRGGGNVLVATAATGVIGNLMAGDRADNAAEDGAGRGGSGAAGGQCIDAGDDAAVTALALAVAVVVAAVVVTTTAVARGGCAAGQGEAGDGTCSNQLDLHGTSPWRLE